MARCQFTAQAVEDLRAIGRYTRETWGLAQARRYRQELELSLKKLSLTPLMGHVREEIGENVHSFPVGSHIAYYLARKSGITVLRLLHSRMDVERAFSTTDEKP
jgi:toxin ParE1/3/4